MSELKLGNINLEASNLFPQLPNMRIQLPKEFLELQEKLEKIYEPIRKQQEEIRRKFDTPHFRRLSSIEQYHCFPHEVLYDLFDDSFQEKDVKLQWRSIRAKLWARFPESLKNGIREENYKQILKCQTAGAYVVVCRAIYPEIEAMFRDEVLLSDVNWRQKWESFEKAHDRRKFQATEFSRLTQNDHDEFELVDGSATIDEIGHFTTFFVLKLSSSFRSFDPKDTERKHIGARHLYCHGWKNEASFMDGLTGLLLFDMAARFIATMKENKEETS
jgi:hypothetical protein